MIAGLPWPQHIAFLDSAQQERQIRQALRAEVSRLGRHSAVALVALDNEIPASIVRWHGPRRVERFLHQLYDDAKQVRPETLLTYVNFPPTEYLELPFFDVCAFNLYLHDAKALSGYLAVCSTSQAPGRAAGGSGPHSFREGPDGQAALTAMQLEGAFAAGACGAVAFSWTDEWWRGGYPVEDWAFGLVNAEREPKPALAAVSRVFASARRRRHRPARCPSCR